MHSNTIKVKARAMPRDATDIFVGVLRVVIFLILPSAIAFFLTRSFVWALLTYVAIYLIFLAFTVWSLRLSESGIEFVRLLGRPRLVRWEEITEISEAPRRELIVYGWLWPRFPTREMTPCCSTLRHFRIRWGSDFCYYPPGRRGRLFEVDR
jgi:hypothetical protein